MIEDAECVTQFVLEDQEFNSPHCVRFPSEHL
jgi:hypothetical protein